jgi:hypothetical protein
VVLSCIYVSELNFLSSDMIGHIECYPLGNQQTAANKGTSKWFSEIFTSDCGLTAVLASARAYCYEMKVIEGFSWAIFVLCEFDQADTASGDT